VLCQARQNLSHCQLCMDVMLCGWDFLSPQLPFIWIGLVL